MYLNKAKIVCFNLKKEMLKTTLESDPDFKVLTTLVNQIVEVTQFVNNESSHRDKLQKVIDTSQRLTNTPEVCRLLTICD